MDRFNDIAGKIAEDAVQYAMKNGIVLDYTRESIPRVDAFLETFHGRLETYEGDEGGKILWNTAVRFGVYIGEVMLRAGLSEKGFVWVMNEGLPILGIPGVQIAASPITKAHKRILNGPEDSLESFADVAFAIAKEKLPKTRALRVPDVEMASGKKAEKVILKEADSYIALVAEGKEDFVIFESHDGFFQFYGAGNQFVCEVWFNLGGRRAYALLNPDCANTGRVNLVTPFGQYTPRERDILSLQQLKTALYAYYSNHEEADFLAEIPHEVMEV